MSLNIDYALMLHDYDNGFATADGVIKALKARDAAWIAEMHSWSSGMRMDAESEDKLNDLIKRIANEEAK